MTKVMISFVHCTSQLCLLAFLVSAFLMFSMLISYEINWNYFNKLIFQCYLIILIIISSMCILTRACRMTHITSQYGYL